MVTLPATLLQSRATGIGRAAWVWRHPRGTLCYVSVRYSVLLSLICSALGIYFSLRTIHNRGYYHILLLYGMDFIIIIPGFFDATCQEYCLVKREFYGIVLFESELRTVPGYFPSDHRYSVPFLSDRSQRWELMSAQKRFAFVGERRIAQDLENKISSQAIITAKDAPDDCD